MSNKGRFTKGNQAAKKLTSPELKLEAYRQYCDYIASGKCKEAWHFEHPELTLTWETMEKYIREDASVFEPYKKKVAEARSLEIWEQKGWDMLSGKSKAEVALYQLFMRNKFGWDRDNQITHTFQPDCIKIFEKWNKKT